MVPPPSPSGFLYVGIALSLLVAGTGGAAAATPQPTAISSCTTLSSPGQYVLTADVRNGGASACLVIRASGVTLDGNGHTVDGVDDRQSVGVLVSGSASGATVGNLVVTDWGDGLRYEG